ncbi:carbohydrate ABC transporter substrate-binding protein, CUT1 family [Thermomonospora echinospora]|uniref:Carbohydrate ABC transporter substrate-binding protein, CUT1 family n=1 Tax=Thermomonospora echinospora TaxID=1992 RepID=A0A1H6E0U8_9ACTN|nr:ABC transporter substrate-binding protein [Thermomonospora echinospora]SEG91192.1 carbohydrate ABC transporter substrate-binding protein, CUT1 family [Thermomonospora echinospora]
MRGASCGTVRIGPDGRRGRRGSGAGAASRSTPVSRHGRRPGHGLASRTGAATAVLLLGGLAAGCGPGDGGRPVIHLYNAPQRSIGALVERCNRLAHGRYRIVVGILPRDAAGRRAQIVRRLAAGDPGPDVIGMDVTWTAELAEAGWIRPWTGVHARRARQGTLARPLETATWRGRLYGAPYHTNVQLLWYRSDLIPRPPATWRGLIRESRRLAAAGKPHFGEVTGAPYEGIVVWFNSLVASAGGSVLTSAGDAVSLGEPGLRALRVMRDYDRSPAADPSLPSMRDDDARLAMEGGGVAYQVNWPFVYPSMAANRPHMLRHLRWAPYPGITGPGRAPLGGANFGISAHSRHPGQAFRAALCLRDAESQQIAAVRDGLPPTIRAVYDKPEMARAYPMRQEILRALDTAAPRPRTPSYQHVSTAISTVLSPPEAIDPPRTLARLRDLISKALEGRRAMP